MKTIMDPINTATTCKHCLPTQLFHTEVRGYRKQLFHKAPQTKFGSLSTDQNQSQQHAVFFFLCCFKLRPLRNREIKCIRQLDAAFAHRARGKCRILLLYASSSPSSMQTFAPSEDLSRISPHPRSKSSRHRKGGAREEWKWESSRKTGMTLEE